MGNKSIFNNKKLINVCIQNNLLSNANQRQLFKILVINETKTLNELVLAIYICSNKSYNYIFNLLSNELIKQYTNKKA